MKNWNRIPTYDECVEMCKTHGDMIFYMTEKFVQGFKIHVFSYRYAQPQHFIKPLENNDVTAHDLRGLTFVFNEDGTIYKRFVGLPKFWNINQCGESLYEDFKDKKIDSVYDKRDGSMVTFIQLPNGNIVPKTKGSICGEKNCYEFFPEILEIYNNDEDLRVLVEACLEYCDIVPIFEYTSFENKIVLRYDENELTLLRLRDNITGQFIDTEYSTYRKIADKVEFNSLEEIMEAAKTAEDLEGWVIMFEDGTLLKQKTAWYFDRHQITTDEVTRSNRIACMFLDETLDDTLSLLDPESDKQRLDKINVITEKLITFMDNEYNRIMEIYNTTFVGEFNSDKKIFASQVKRDRDFGFVMGVANGRDLRDQIKQWVRKEAYYLAKMENFLETGAF